MNEFAFYLSSGKPFSKHTRVHKDVLQSYYVFMSSLISYSFLAVVD